MFHPERKNISQKAKKLIAVSLTLNEIYDLARIVTLLYKKIKKNKCLLKVGKKTLIENTILAVKEAKILDLSIVVGFKAKKIKSHLKKYNKIKFIINKKYNSIVL